jgi:hypothetical protein
MFCSIRYTTERSDNLPAWFRREIRDHLTRVRFGVLGFRLLPAASIAKFNKPLVCQLGIPRPTLDLKIKQLKINKHAIR